MTQEEIEKLNIGDTIAYNIESIGITTTAIIKHIASTGIYVSQKRIPGTGEGYIKRVLPKDFFLKDTTIKIN